MAQDGSWVDHMFVQVLVLYIELDILILTTSSNPENPFICINGTINNIPGVAYSPPLIIGNYTNVHYQSLLPKLETLNQEKEQKPRNSNPTPNEQKNDDFIFLHNGDTIIFRILEKVKFQCPYCKNLLIRIVKHINNQSCKIIEVNIDMQDLKANWIHSERGTH